MINVNRCVANLASARFLIAILLVLSFAGRATSQSGGTWAYTTGAPNTFRSSHTATTLTNGEIMIAGGASQTGYVLQAELYNPSTEIFTYTGSLNDARANHTATLLNNGMVLLVGGWTEPDGNATYLNSAELYNPATGNFSVTGSLNTARAFHTATLLPNGQVLIAGGVNSSGVLASAEIYNPTTNQFSPAGNLNAARESHSATLLDTGMVLLVGGYNGTGVNGFLISAELYNPATGSFATTTGSLHSARASHTATLLNNGQVLVAGGMVDAIACDGYPASAELYNPSTGTFAVTGSLNTPRAGNTATLLDNGTVLVAGGSQYKRRSPSGCGFTYFSNAEIYDPGTGAFTYTGSMNVTRSNHSSSLLANGMAVAVAGFNSQTAEQYEPTSFTPSGLESITLSPPTPWIPIGGSMNFAANGLFSGNVTETLSSATWSSSNTSVATVTSDPTNYGHVYGVSSGTATIEACAGSTCGSVTVTVAPHTNILLGGGLASGTFETHDDSGNLVTQGNLSPARNAQSATLLTNGTIFVAGGQDEDGTWQILTPTGQALSSGTLENGFYSHLAVRLANGNVLLAGGGASPGAWEIHNPTGGLVGSGSLLGSRTPGAGAVALQNTNVFIAGSSMGAHSDESTWEIHDINGNLVSNGTLFSPFVSSKMFVLSNGYIVLVGGTFSSSTYQIYTETGTLVTEGDLINGFDSGAGAALVNNDVFIFESGYWEFIGFDANANETFDTTGSLLDARTGAKAVVTSQGNIFITGGSSASGSWEMYAPNGSSVTLVSSGTLFDARDNQHTDTHF